MTYSSINLNDLVGLDFETYGSVSLPDHGLERYVSDPHFTPLIASVVAYTNGRYHKERFDLWNKSQTNYLRRVLAGKIVCAHNAGFEERVIRWIGGVGLKRYIDSAVVARAMGAAGKLEAAAPQLLGHDKLADGGRLIRLFSIPSKEQREDGGLDFDPNLIVQNPEDWNLFHEYCDLDAELSLMLVVNGLQMGWISDTELQNQDVTMKMNQLGWRVDLDTVTEMQARYLENQATALENFRLLNDAADLNLNSHPQQVAWCLERGIKARSFDEKSVAKLLGRITEKLDTMDPHDPHFKGYRQVEALLRTKQILGGSSLKKLKVILDTTGADGILRDQYLHIGAGQTWRTTGRSVQMQNLKRLGENPDDMTELDDPDSEWDNEKLALNLRQVFTSRYNGGRLIVGDFSSVESRGLAWLAGAEDKLNAFRKGLDIYKVGAAKQYGVAYDHVTKPQRQFGKVGELSCGYQAAGGAVKSFAAGMGVDLTEAEAANIVAGWRDANPEIVNLWNRLDKVLHHAFRTSFAVTTVGGGYEVQVQHAATPSTLSKMHPGAVSLIVRLVDSNNTEVMRRIFHGVYERGRSLCYYRPTERKTGDVWVNHFKDPKTKEVRFYNIYGGKLSGILTQSLCRQMFFTSLRAVAADIEAFNELDIVGQFHDEIVLDWGPNCEMTLTTAALMLKRHMSRTRLPGFPLTAEVKHDYRYTK